MNGDGLPDIVGISNQVYVSLNTGSGFGPAQVWSGAYGAATGWTDSNAMPRFLVDMNGDGLPDIVGISGQVYVSLNTGTGFAQPQVWSPAYGSATGWTSSSAMPRFLADVNGDGLPDIVGISGQTYVSLNTGTGFGAAQVWTGYFGAANLWTDSGTMPRFVADVNGDGRADIVGMSGNAYFSVAPSGPPPDLLSFFTDGFGATTVITYKPLTDRAVYTKDTSTLPFIDVQGPLYVVSQVAAPNGLGGAYNSTYAYVGAKADQQGRGFLGYRQRVATDAQTGIAQTTNYNQSYPYIGLAAGKTKTLGAQTLNQTTNTYGATSLGGTRYFVSLGSSVESSFDLDGSAIPPVTTSYGYDVYGNPTTVTVSTADGYSKTTANTYTNDATNWFLGRLTRATVTSTTP